MYGYGQREGVSGEDYLSGGDGRIHEIMVGRRSVRYVERFTITLELYSNNVGPCSVEEMVPYDGPLSALLVSHFSRMNR